MKLVIRKVFAASNCAAATVKTQGVLPGIVSTAVDANGIELDGFIEIDPAQIAEGQVLDIPEGVRVSAVRRQYEDAESGETKTSTWLSIA